MAHNILAKKSIRDMVGNGMKEAILETHFCVGRPKTIHGVTIPESWPSPVYPYQRL
jgi:hypothetical protein